MLVVRGVGGVHRSRLRSVLASAPPAAVTVGVFAAALAGLVSAPVALVLAVAPICLMYTFWLGGLARAVGRTATWRAGGTGVLLLGAGIGAGGLCLFSALAAAGTTAAAGFVVATGLLVAGLLWLPGTAATGRARARRVIDGAGTALWKFLTLWVLLLEAHGLAPVPFAVALTAITGVTVAVVIGVRTPYPRGAAVTAAGGAVAAMLGLTVLTLLLLAHRIDGWLLVGGGLLAAGAVLAWLGAWNTCSDALARTGPLRPAVADGTLVGDPLLVAPVLAGLAAVGYSIFSTGHLGGTTIAVGVAAVLAVAVREAFALLDVRGLAGQLAVQEAHFQSLVAGSTDVIVLLNGDLTVRWQSPAAARQFGLSDQDVAGRPFTELVHADDGSAVGRVMDALRAAAQRAATPAQPAAPDQPGPVQVRFRDGFGVWRDVEIAVSDLGETTDVDTYVVHLRDVGERTQLERMVREAARTDPLTHLTNRVGLVRQIPSPRGPRATLLTLELDGFAGIHDAYGTDVGNAVLAEVARRIRATVAPTDVPARLGDDRFGVLTRGTPMRAYTLATALLAEIGQPYRLPGETLHLSAAVGLADAAEAPSPDDALRRAELALRRARHAGRGSIEWHDQSAETAHVRRTLLQQHLPGVLGRGELDLAYQAVYDLVEDVPIGMEALLRWRHPGLGTVPARETIEVARGLGMTGELHRWVVNQACRQLARWQREGYDLWMSVNVAVDDLLADGFAADLGSVLESHLVPPRQLVVEVAERDLDGRLDAVCRTLVAVRERGVRVALDGFGIGATSLASLRQLPVDIIKIDQSLFVEPPGHAGPAAPILDVVVELSNRLGLDTIAHGLECPSQLPVVRKAGCRYGQGHVFGVPAPAERAEATLVPQRVL